MGESAVLDIGKQALLVSMKIAAPSLLAIMVTGIVVSVFQAATQINEQTLSFIPKMVAFFVTIFVVGPWIMRTIIIFTQQMFEMIPGVTH